MKFKPAEIGLTRMSIVLFFNNLLFLFNPQLCIFVHSKEAFLLFSFQYSKPITSCCNTSKCMYFFLFSMQLQPCWNLWACK